MPDPELMTSCWSTAVPTTEPTPEPTSSPTHRPTSMPTLMPSSATAVPTTAPSETPTTEPTTEPTEEPTAPPTDSPTHSPTDAEPPSSAAAEIAPVNCCGSDAEAPANQLVAGLVAFAGCCSLLALLYLLARLMCPRAKPKRQSSARFAPGLARGERRALTPAGLDVTSNPTSIGWSWGWPPSAPSRAEAPPVNQMALAVVDEIGLPSIIPVRGERGRSPRERERRQRELAARV